MASYRFVQFRTRVVGNEARRLVEAGGCVIILMSPSHEISKCELAGQREGVKVLAKLLNAMRDAGAIRETKPRLWTSKSPTLAITRLALVAIGERLLVCRQSEESKRSRVDGPS